MALVCNLLNAAVYLNSRDRINTDADWDNPVRRVSRVNLLVNSLAEAHVLLLPLFYARCRFNARAAHVLLVVAEDAGQHCRRTLVLRINHDGAATINMKPPHNLSKQRRLAGAELSAELRKTTKRKDVCLQEITGSERRQR